MSLRFPGRKFSGMSRRFFVAGLASAAGHGILVACAPPARKNPGGPPSSRLDRDTLFGPGLDGTGQGGDAGVDQLFCDSPGGVTSAFNDNATPRFFGAETRLARTNSNIGTHDKWKDFLQRHKADMQVPDKYWFLENWLERNLGQYKTKPEDNLKPEVIMAKAMQVDHAVDQAIKYVFDQDLYGKNDTDHWATPWELLNATYKKDPSHKGWGDCEDSAFLKYVALRWLGVPTDRIYNVHVHTGQDENGVDWWHIMNMVNVAPEGKPEQFVILNNQEGAAGQVEKESDYQGKYTPLYAMNENVFLVVLANNKDVTDKNLEPLPMPPHKCQHFITPFR